MEDYTGETKMYNGKKRNPCAREGCINEANVTEDPRTEADFCSLRCIEYVMDGISEATTNAY